MFLSISLFAQVENVPLEHFVYSFLNEMKVKKIIDGLDEDVPNLSYNEVKEYLIQIEEQKSALSTVEQRLLEKYKMEFVDDVTDENTFELFGGETMFKSPLDIFNQKVKYLYAYKGKHSTLYFHGIGHFNFAQRFQPNVNNAELYDIGFRLRGTIIDRIGYNIKVIKGGVSGNRDFATVADPRLLYNFKFVEDIEPIKNYDFTTGYLQYHTSPVEDMDITFQIGREKITLGYGYNSKLVLSGDHPDFDFIKLNFEYGILDFTSIHASTVGEFDHVGENRFTKYFAMNRIKFTIPDILSASLGEVIVYSGRGLELAYLNPLIFYKFAEMSLQDRDNGTVYFEVQSNAIKNLELQGTFFMDENFIGKMGELSRFNNKTAYQLGAHWYEAFSLSNLSLYAEYTRIRPYVYTHKNFQTSYSSWGTSAGHQIGPNADEIYLASVYNLNENIRPGLSFSYIRKGENVYDEAGNLIKNVGGDVFQPHRKEIDSEYAPFLDGNRINTTKLELNCRLEPSRDIIFDLSYNYIFSDYVTEDFSEDLSYLQMIMTLQF